MRKRTRLEFFIEILSGLWLLTGKAENYRQAAPLEIIGRTGRQDWGKIAE
jgi:hypothetical protein